MRLVQIIPHDRLGGMQEVAHALDQGLPAHGVDSRLLNLAEWTGKRPLPLATSWLRLVRRWRRERPDAVMAHTLVNALYTLPAARAAGIGQRLVVVHAGRDSLGSIRTAILAALAASRTATQVVFVGQSAADSFVGLMGLGRGGRVIQNGIRLPRPAAAAPHDGPAGPSRLMLAGRLVPEKNVEAAIHAVVGLPDAELDIFGDGPERGRLQQLAAQLAAPARFHGAVDRAELHRRMRDSSLFLFPSRAEGLPLVLIEAVSLGVPVVASTLPCNREVLGESALYCHPDDTAGWRKAIVRLLGDAEERTRIINAGHERAELFTVERMVRDYATLLGVDGS